jgi:tetraacyldisaccharide 4'-kinase
MKIWLWPYSLASRGVSRLKDRLYRSGVFGTKRAGLKVISVGNISLGGTGKTPLALEVIKLLRSEGVRTALVTRGYKGRWEKQGGILTDGEKFYGRWEDSGDEPFMIARNVPGAGVFVGRNRLRSCRLAKVKGFAAAVLDDGFQRRRLARDLDIVLFDPHDRILREPVASLARAQAILLPEAEAPRHREALGRRFPGSRLYSYSVVPKGFFKPGIRHDSPAPNLSETRVLAFCGLARPRNFFGLLREQGLELAATIALPDHHPYPPSTLERILKKYRSLDVRAAVTTEKDAVKLAGRREFLKEIPVYYLKIGVQVESAFFDQVRRAILKPERRR